MEGENAIPCRKRDTSQKRINFATNLSPHCLPSSKVVDQTDRPYKKGEEPKKVSGGYCLVNWPTTCMLKKLGGLGILDIERLARALRLRWCWFQWKNEERSWTGM